MTKCRFHLLGSSSPRWDPIGCPETSVNKYQYTQRNRTVNISVGTSYTYQVTLCYNGCELASVTFDGMFHFLLDSVCVRPLFAMNGAVSEEIIPTVIQDIYTG